jgi:tetratricopeptide (TPR) repeat protein/transcriptional regulator with XRE-family HTH domain
MNGLGAIIRAGRASLGLSQEALAEAVHVSPRTISRWEQGQAIPQPEHRRRLALLFGIEPGELAPAQQARPWHVPFRRNPLFTGRAEELDRMSATLSPNGSGLRVLALTGLPGVGKTQSALEFAYRHGDVYSGVFWLAADSREGCLAALGELAEALDLSVGPDPDRGHALTQVGRWLRQHAGWLLVLDNLEDPNLLDEVAPDGPGSVLVTTRARAFGTAGERLTLVPLSRAEGCRFLLRRARVVSSEEDVDHASVADRATAEVLVTRLGGLPLALDQAGAYVEETGCGLELYLDRFSARQQVLLARRGRLAVDHPNSVTATLELACGRVERMNPAAAEMLRLCAFLHPDAIPLEVLTAGDATALGPGLGHAVADPFRLDETLADLATLSLVHRDPRSETLTVHRLVQDVVRGTLSHDEQHLWAERAVGAVAAALPDSAPYEYDRVLRFVSQGMTAIELADRWQLQSRAAARLLDRMGAHHLLAGESATAAPLLLRAWRLRREVLGGDHLDTAETLTHLARLAFARGHYARGETLARAALSIRRCHLGALHPLAGSALALLGDILIERGRYAEAEPLLEQALAIQCEDGGSRHPRVAETLNRLARIPFMQGRYEEAERLVRRALEINTDALGSGHVVTGVTLDWLGTVYRYWGRNQDAAIQFERALACLIPAVGNRHPSVLTVLNGLARAKLGLGDAGAAEPLARSVLDARERLLGPEHPGLAFSLQCLSEILLERGRPTDAMALARRALAIRERTYGTEHQTVALSLDLQAQIHQRQGDLGEAERLYLRALKTLDKAVGDGHPRSVPTLRRYARLLEQARRHEDAAAQLQRADSIRQRSA